jgi:hypothetical protein
MIEAASGEQPAFVPTARAGDTAGFNLLAD